jgi:hypothetical protein
VQPLKRIAWHKARRSKMHGLTLIFVSVWLLCWPCLRVFPVLLSPGGCRPLLHTEGNEGKGCRTFSDSERTRMALPSATGVGCCKRNRPGPHRGHTLSSPYAHRSLTLESLNLETGCREIKFQAAIFSAI